MTVGELKCLLTKYDDNSVVVVEDDFGPSDHPQNRLNKHIYGDAPDTLIRVRIERRDRGDYYNGCEWLFEPHDQDAEGQPELRRHWEQALQSDAYVDGVWLF